MVRWLMTVRKNGRWGNTQENAYAMQALVSYYRKFEPDAPNFRAMVRLGEQELRAGEFRGRIDRSRRQSRFRWPQVAPPAPSRRRTPLTFTREGTGTLFYTRGCATPSTHCSRRDSTAGFRIERSYEPFRRECSETAGNAVTRRVISFA